MRTKHFLILAWLATISTALVPHYEQRGTDLPSGAYLEHDHIVLDPLESRNNLPYYEDPYVYSDPDSVGRHPSEHNETIEPPNSTGWNSTAMSNLNSPVGRNSTALTNVDNPVLSIFPSEPKMLYAEARVGNEGQHVGTLRKKRLEDAIYQCLKWSCPLDDPKRGLNPCTQMNTKSCRVYNIVYNANPHDKYATDAHLDIYVNYAYHNPAWPGIGEAVYRAVASFYRILTDQEGAWYEEYKHYFPGACYDTNFPMSRKTKMCNVPRSASVGFPVSTEHPTGDASEVQAMAAIDIFFSGLTEPSDYNVYHTHGAFEKMVADVSRKEWLPKFAEAIGRPLADLDTRLNYEVPSGTCMAWWWYENEKCRHK